MNTTANPNIGKYISGVNKIWKKFGKLLLFSMTAFNPDPSETPTNICGAMPINEPKKKFFTLTP